MSSRSEVVLDASALIALLRSERGNERVAACMERAVIGAVNLAEVASKLVREEVPINVIEEWIDELELRIEPLDDQLAYAVGALLPATQNQGLSLGDRACLALAHRLGATALTTDRVWAEVDVGVAVEVIR